MMTSWPTETTTRTRVKAAVERVSWGAFIASSPARMRTRSQRTNRQYVEELIEEDFIIDDLSQ